MWYLDYSSGTLSAATIKLAGYGGVIRYIDSPDRLNPPGRLPKHTTKAEYDDHIRNGLDVWLVFQGTTTDADGGFPAGQANARRALAGAEYLGYRGPIFFTNDRTTLPSPVLWRGYLDGAASILGRSRTGAYGFRNAMDAAIGHAAWFWQAGRRSDVASHVHFWQDNNTQVTVGGKLCDRNLVLKDISGKGTDTVSVSWSDELRNSHNGEVLKVATYITDTYNRTGWTLDEAEIARAEVEAAREDLNTVNTNVLKVQDTADRIEKKLDTVTSGGVDVDALADRVVAKVFEKLSKVQV